MKTVNPESWNRKEYFDFFSKFDEPFFGIVTEIDCTEAYRIVKENNYSFFAFYLHKSISAINKIPEFRYRINNNEIVVYDKIHVSPTIGRDDGSFGFAFLHYVDDFQVFSRSLSAETERVQNSTGLGLGENEMRNDVAHCTSVPWIKFTGVTHARQFKYADSIPKIAFGKAWKSGDRMVLPTSINVHHGFLDGFHVAKYLELFQKLMNGE
ncbi:MAG: chloramphenicol acetyltransferase [Bacteroidetes bacterium]|nr:chloramphenicol acetyltransferase [Bacteroidota bacterium]